MAISEANHFSNAVKLRLSYLVPKIDWLLLDSRRPTIGYMSATAECCFFGVENHRPQQCAIQDNVFTAQLAR